MSLTWEWKEILVVPTSVQTTLYSSYITTVTLYINEILRMDRAPATS
jgi:hypothetical protein